MTDFTTSRTMMVDTQVRPSDVTKFPIIEAMLSVKRENFVPDLKRDVAYMGEHIYLGGGRVMLDPRTFAKMLDAVTIDQKDIVLDLGCGLGYSSAVLARMCEAVIALEDDPDRVAQAETRLGEAGADNVAVIEGVLSEGAAKHGPYDIILIQGAVQTVPDALLEQLKEDGRIVAIFTEGALGEARVGVKVNGTVSWRMDFNASAPVLSGFEKQSAFAL